MCWDPADASNNHFFGHVVSTMTDTIKVFLLHVSAIQNYYFLFFSFSFHVFHASTDSRNIFLCWICVDLINANFTQLISCFFVVVDVTLQKKLRHCSLV